MKKVSIVIPVWNTAEFLDECFHSLQKQSYKELEIIFINDGSTDESYEKLENYSKEDSRVIVYHFDESQGVAKTRNFGINKATGDFLYFMDSDDALATNTIEHLIQSIGEEDFIFGKIETMHYLEEKNLEEVGEIKRKSTKNLFKKPHLLNGLIRKEALQKYDLSFSEDLTYYSEMAFILPIVEKFSELLYVENSVYYKRIRNDKITNPSLHQKGKREMIQDFLTMYLRFKEHYQHHERIQHYLDGVFLRLYRKKMIPYFVRARRILSVFEQLSQAANICRAQEDTPWFIKREMNMLQKGKLEKYKSTLRQHGRAKKLKTMLSGRTKFYLQLYRTVFLKMPVKENLIVFESFLGKNYSDSPKYIYEYIQQQGLDFECVWIFNETGKDIPGNAKQIKRFSKDYYYYLARAKYWVSNSRMPKSLNKRPENIYLQTWHGTPLKKLVFDMKDVLSANPNYKNDFYQQSRRWDYLIAPNRYSSDIFKSAFKFEKEMLEFGYPRNDILYQQNNEQDIATLKQKLHLPKDKKIILYAPTWRDNDYHQQGKYKFSLQLDLDKMKKELGSDYIILLRMHYFISDNLELSSYEEFAYDVSRYDDIAELYLLSDVLITDYSSVMFDYANTKRPILFYTYDLETYRDQLRGFYFDFEQEAPGPLLKTTEGIIESIAQLEETEETYREKYEQFYEKFCGWEDGHATEKVVEIVFGENIEK